MLLFSAARIVLQTYLDELSDNAATRSTTLSAAGVSGPLRAYKTVADGDETVLLASCLRTISITEQDLVEFYHMRNFQLDHIAMLLETDTERVREAIDAGVMKMADGTSSAGTGGMASKLEAAALCQRSGVPTLIASRSARPAGPRRGSAFSAAISAATVLRPSPTTAARRRWVAADNVQQMRRTNAAIIDGLLNTGKSRVKAAVETNLELYASFIDSSQGFIDCSEIGCNRFFTEDVFACFGSVYDERGMGIGRGRNQNRIDTITLNSFEMIISMKRNVVGIGQFLC